MFQNLQKKTFFPTVHYYKDDLPVSHARPKVSHPTGLRKRISSSSSVKIQPTLSSASTEWAFMIRRSSKCLPSLALRRWWDWGWAWILSRKPAFGRDLEMNEEETATLGNHSKGCWRHIFYIVRSEIRKLMQSHTTLPTTQ